MRIIILFLFLLTVSCSDSDIELITLDIDKATIPKGIAIHPESNDIYISSLHLDQLTKTNVTTGRSEVIFNQEEHGYTRGASIDIIDNRLYALGHYDRDTFSMLYIKNLDTDRALSFKADSLGSTHFNDLAIDINGNCYITDSDQNRVYKYSVSNHYIDTFYIEEQIKRPNGIAISKDQTKLFVDSYSHGIRIIDIASKTILNKLHSPTAQWGVSSIKYHKEKLFFIVNGIKDKSQHGLYSLDLIDNETEFGNLDPVLVFHKKMRSPTTFSIVNDNFYILANSQIDLLDQKNNAIIDTSKLTDTYILKKKILNIQ